MMTTLQTKSRATLAENLRISIARLSRRMRAQIGSSLSTTQLAALAAVDTNGSMTPGELAEHEKVQPPSMTRVIAALEDQRLLVRTKHPTDGRQALLSVTDQGRALLREERRRKEVWLARQLADLTEEEMEIMRQAAPILEKLSRAS
jgi:DNA-binding MarR family transcriptional regulator